MSSFLSLMGFAKKAGKLTAGSNAVLRSVLSGNSDLVIITTDAGDSIKEKFTRICEENEVNVRVYGNSEDISYATGEKNKVIYSIEDYGFARKLVELIMEVQ